MFKKSISLAAIVTEVSRGAPAGNPGLGRFARQHNHNTRNQHATE